MFYFFFFKQKTAYEMRISDWSSDVCSSDLQELRKKQQEDERLARAIRTAIQREIAEQRRLEEEARKAALALEAERTGKTVAEVEAEKPAVRKSDTEVLANTPAAAKLSADFAGNRGRLPWPVQQGIITQRFEIGRAHV